MLHLALRNLFQGWTRLIVSIGGVALAMTLILTLNAIVAGSERQITAYIDYSGADVIVSQAGVRTLHMSASSVSTRDLTSIRAEPGVASVTPILYMTNMLVVGDQRSLAYVIGLPAGAQAGAPWRMEAGARIPGSGKAVIDADVARQGGVGIGGVVTILGQPFTISGLATGTASITNSVAFISFDDFAQMRGATTASVSVSARPSAKPSTTLRYACVSATRARWALFAPSALSTPYSARRLSVAV